MLHAVDQIGQCAVLQRVCLLRYQLQQDKCVVSYVFFGVRKEITHFIWLSWFFQRIVGEVASVCNVCSVKLSLHELND